MRKTWLSSEDGVDLAVEFARRVEVVAEGLFDHHGDMRCPCSGCAMPCAPRFSTMPAKNSGAVAR